MTTLLLNKPYGVLSQFTPEEGSRWRCLSDFVDTPQVYAAGRLDADSEGLLILTSNGRLQQRLTDPRFGHWRSYWAQVEGTPNTTQLQQLCDGVMVQGRQTLPAKARWLQGQDQPQLAERTPPIRYRAAIPTSWLLLSLTEGRNRQVRRMTAAVGLPTLRLVRCCIDLMDNGPPLDLTGLQPGSCRVVTAAEQERLNRLISSSSSAGAQRGGHRRGGHRRG
ncbi:pseudouridine synthase [Synechococcus sp. HIMB2401]|uniref:pseudouridine synthase n=1 Tax=Synechococcus sp. HIMB2401 TaxID=3144208 RepID=UPI0036F3A95B